MQRILAKTTAGRLIITQSRAAQAGDALANLVIAAFTGFAVAIPASAGAHGGASVIAILLLVPPLWFLILGLISAAGAVAPAQSIFDRESGEIVIRGKACGRLDELSDLKIVYSGLAGPSRHTLVAIFTNGKTVPIESTGYLGNKLELEQLSALIGDFLGRIDLYARA